MDTTRVYIIAATPRTGSYLLCEALQATRIAGRPSEFFNPDMIERWRQRWALTNPSFQAYLSAALRQGTTTNGVFGLKIHWMHVNGLARKAHAPTDGPQILDQLFPGVKIVNLVRRDGWAQAISYFRARCTGEWWRIEGAEPAKSMGDLPVFDPNKIAALKGELTGHQEHWVKFLASRDSESMTVEYEDLANHYEDVVSRVLAFLELDSAAARGLRAPRLMRQTDDLTLRWRQELEAAEFL